MGSSQQRMRTWSDKSSAKRKYLGDPEDPHFTPSSPMISRQSLSFEQEEELTRSCTLVLSGVPHSDGDDDDNDDPLFKYISNHVTHKQNKAHQETETNRLHIQKPSAGVNGEASYKSHKFRHVNADTATPSVASKRDTIDRTNTSTPMTILSEKSLRKSSSSRQNAALRAESRCTKPQAIHTRFETTQINDVRDLAPSKSTTMLPRSSTVPQNASGITGEKLGRISVSHAEFNKSLPSIPKVSESQTSQKHPVGFLRVFKSSPNYTGDSITNAATGSQAGSLPRAHTTSDILQPQTKKKRFNLPSLFSRKSRHQQTRLVES